MVPWSGTPLTGEDEKKSMLLVHAQNLPAAVRNRGSAAVRLVAWFPPGAAAPAAHHAKWREAVDLCIAADGATASRLALLTPRVLLAAPGAAVLATATKWADSRAFWEATRPPMGQGRQLPRVFRRERPGARVLLQADGFTQGGMEQVVLDLACSLRAEKFDVSLLILGEQGQDAARVREAGIPVLSLPEEDRESHYRRLLKEQRIEVVNAHYSLFGAPIATAAGVPFVQTIHNTYIFLPPHGVAEYQANDPYTSAYVCVSQMAAHYSDVKLGLPVSKMVVVPNGIDLGRMDAEGADTRQALRRELGIAGDDFVFLNVGSLQSIKCQATLVHAFADVVRRFPQAKLVLVGRALKPAYLDEVKETIARHGLEKAVVLAGHRDDAARFYAAADAFVLPSLCEGWSLALAEAIAAGLPVVATSVGSAPDLLPRIGGRLIRPPFGDITNLDFVNLGKYTAKEDPIFVAELAAALTDLCRNRARPVVPDAFRRSLDRREAYKPYGQLFLWLAQGGHPGAARCWAAGRLDPTAGSVGSAGSTAGQTVGVRRALPSTLPLGDAVVARKE